MSFFRSRLVPSVQRRVRRQIRVHVRSLVSRGPRILHLVLAGTEGQNRGDASMSLVIPRILRRIRPDVNFSLCRMFEVRRDVAIAGEVGPCDMIVIGGGGLYGPWFDLTRFAALKELGVPIVLYALGVNLRHGMTELPAKNLQGVRSLNAVATLSSVRDAASQQYLDQHGIRTEVIGDPAAFYDPVGEGNHHARGTLNIGLNLPYHESTLRDETDTLAIPVIRRVAQDLLRQGARLHYLLHHPAERNVLRQLQGLPITVHRCGPHRLIQHYHKLDLVICSMLHSAIFSFNAETPFIIIGYDQKHEGFMDLIKARTRYVPLAEISYDWLRDATEINLRELPKIRAELAAARSRLWQSHRAFAEAALALLPGAS